MNKRLKTIKILYCTICLSLVMSLSACTNSNNNTNKYLEMIDSPSTTLDNVWYNPGGVFRCAIFESLLMVDADMTTIRCALAKDYSISDDQLTYSFTLREDVTWHDGESFSIDDVLFSIKCALDTEEINGILHTALHSIEGANAYSNGETSEISGITADGNTLTLKLTTPSAHFLNAIAQFAILPEHILGDTDPQQLSTHEYWNNPIGCGCYKIAEAVAGEHFILETYDDYYGAKPGIHSIRLRLNEEDCVKAMQEGTLDFYITNDPEEIADLKGLEHCSEHPLNILFPSYLILNLSNDEGVNPQLRDVRVRKALLLAIDRKTIVDAIFPGSTVIDTMIPSWDNYYLQEAETYDFNPDEARRLLEEANYDFSNPIRLRYFTKGQSTSDLINAIAVYWQAIGINVNVEKFDGSGSEHMFNIRDFDICYKRLSAFNHASIYEEVHSDGVMQNKLLNQPVYDDLLNKLNATMQQEDRIQIIKDIQSLDQEHLLRLPLFSLANVAYVNDTHFNMPEAYGNLWYRYNLCFEDWRLMN